MQLVSQCINGKTTVFIVPETKQTLITDYFKVVADCSICAKRDEVYHKCCNMVYCFPCHMRASSMCYVCEKDMLNELKHCDVCGKLNNYFHVHPCTICINKTPEVEMWVCEECNRMPNFPDGSRPIDKTCSWKHTQENFRNMFK